MDDLGYESQIDSHPLLLTIVAHFSLTTSPIRTGISCKTELHFFFIRGNILNNLSHCTCSLTIFFSLRAFFKLFFPDQEKKRSCYFYLVPFIFQKKGTKNDFAQSTVIPCHSWVQHQTRGPHVLLTHSRHSAELT